MQNDRRHSVVVESFSAITAKLTSHNSLQCARESRSGHAGLWLVLICTYLKCKITKKKKNCAKKCTIRIIALIIIPTSGWNAPQSFEAVSKHHWSCDTTPSNLQPLTLSPSKRRWFPFLIVIGVTCLGIEPATFLLKDGLSITCL